MSSKKFSLKDFILYNSPCFNCNIPMEFTLCTKYRSPDLKNSGLVVQTNVLNDKTEINLKISYIDSLSLTVFHKTNKILSSNQDGLVRYLSNNNLSLQSYCKSCGTYIASKDLHFDLTLNYLNLVELHSESFHIKNNTNNFWYHLYSDFVTNRTTATISDPDKIGEKFSIDMPLLPKYKLRDKQHLIDKLNTYLTFS